MKNREGAGRSKDRKTFGILALVATGICAMVGGAINIVPVMLYRGLPDLGPYLTVAFALAGLPAALAAFSYAILASAMPRDGGSYLYISRSLTPFLGFVFSFSYWIGLSVALGVIAYIIVPFIRDLFQTLGWDTFAHLLGEGSSRIYAALIILWFFTLINIVGINAYNRTVVPLMLVMLGCISVVVFAGFSYSHTDFLFAVSNLGEVYNLDAGDPPSFPVASILAGVAVLFASYVGFDAITQVAGEARNAGRTVPIALGVSLLVVGTIFVVYTAAFFHAVPWQYVTKVAQIQDVTIPGLIGKLMSPTWSLFAIAGGATALLNSIPALMMGNSRLVFVWAEDGVIPETFGYVHSVYKTPVFAIIAVSCVATFSIFGCHFNGDFFFGIDLLTTALLVNFIGISCSLLMLRIQNPTLASAITIGKSRLVQNCAGLLGIIVFGLMLAFHTSKDWNNETSHWFQSPSLLWLSVIAVGSVVYVVRWKVSSKAQRLLRKEKFNLLPEI